MKFTLANAKLLLDVIERSVRIESKLDALIFNQQGFQGAVMSKFDELVAEAQAARAAAEASAAAATAALDAVKGFQPAVDAFEARITKLLKDIISPADLQKVDDAIAELRASAAVSKKAAEDAAAAAAAATSATTDAGDNTDEGATLADTFSNVALFTAALDTYTGGSAVTLDSQDGAGAVEVKAGTTPALAYFLQADGTVSNVDPTGGAAGGAARSRARR